MENEAASFNEGRQKGLNEALEFLTSMERRYRVWANANPALTGGMQEGVKGKIEAVMTAKRGLEKLKVVGQLDGKKAD